MAMTDLATVTDTLGIPVTLDARRTSAAALLRTAEMMIDAGTHLIVLDLPAPQVATLAEAVSDRALHVNATAPPDDLRHACFPQLLQSVPSLRMQADTLTQYLRFMNWPRALILEGEHPGDILWADAFTTSAERMGLQITARRTFTLDRNPARRQENNIRLLTGNARYEVIFVADTRGEFGRYIPYATQDPRPVIGSVGLSPTSWHWALERDGATQVSSRFDRTYGRKITAADWNVWIGVKSLILGAAKSGHTDPTALRSYLVSDRLRLDGSKGAPMNFRD
ncbi:branched-chain amino acid ABC transporter substrate-binding protein [Donghicola mangrovi]|uniref:Branched-chain amino acid ABC transporter substrate-binding protein n=1 Tax=Donghicola mangrovi TaxID=2729614 RepID=A0A850Q604_9RHOB|nr:branched-chain amino acid ABC transporter substrate-binding protein [Donghicola mangrovi]NVO24374.1 branched-chain amino acid ABC transporter substrate-binding protein [Donghicola mangrovi]